jgi:hypothetical protein
MQDRYAGDVGDFGKFYLLRTLFDNENDRIGVVWYNYPNEGHNNDGLHIGYLCNEDYATLDSELVRGLASVVKNLCERTITHLETQKLLPEHTVYFSDEITNKSKSEVEREVWFQKALEKVKQCSVIFLDPDNGLEVKSVNKNNKKAGKYVFYDEIKEFVKNGATRVCVVYHHLGRTGGTHNEQIVTRMSEIMDCLKKAKIENHTIYAATFKPFSPRVFFIITAQEKIPQIEFGLKSMYDRDDKLKPKWQFDKIESNGNFCQDFLSQT